MDCHLKIYKSRVPVGWDNSLNFMLIKTSFISQPVEYRIHSNIAQTLNIHTQLQTIYFPLQARFPSSPLDVCLMFAVRLDRPAIQSLGIKNLLPANGKHVIGGEGS